MTTVTETLTTFLLARLADDEAEARQVLAYRGSGTTFHLGHPLDPARVLAQVAALRAVVAEYHGLREVAKSLAKPGQDKPGDEVWVARNMYAGLELALRHLAAIWQDHEAFDPTWRV